MKGGREGKIENFTASNPGEVTCQDTTLKRE